MNNDDTGRFITEYRDKPYPHFVILDRLNVCDGFSPKEIAICTTRVYSRMITEALNARGSQTINANA